MTVASSEGNLLCRMFGHRVVGAGELRYEQNTCIAYVGDERRPEEATVTWVCDEVCARCGHTFWWPS